MYTGVPLWGLSQSQQERPSFVLFLARPSPQWFILHQLYFLASFSFSHGPKPRVWKEKVFFSSSLLFSHSPCLSLFGIYLGIPDSSGFIPTSPSSSLVGCLTLWCVWGTGWKGRRGPRLEASEFKGEAARNVGEGGRKWWSVGCLMDGRKHPEMVKYVGYLTGCAAVG